jgi:Phosphotransferase enzyme family
VSGRADDVRGRGHPAVAAWTALGPTRKVPSVVATLKDRPKCSVYLMEGVGPEGGAVVAKRTRRRLARNEHTLYTRVLPRLSLPALRCHGLVDWGAKSCWLFVDHCAGTPFRPGDGHHRRLAARWLAAMHLRGADVARDVALPDRGVATYLAHLRSTRGRILRGLATPLLDSADRTLLEEVIAGCDALEARWAGIEAACRPLPSTLVHADAKPANLMVRSAARGAELVPLDWAEAGWGVPAVDLVHVDGTVYWEIIGTAWGDVDDDRHQLLPMIGLTFQWLVAINKISAWLARPSYVRRAMDHMPWFRDHLEQALDTVGPGGATRP